MNTPKHFHDAKKHTFKCEFEHCPVCGSPMMISNNISGRKFVQTLKGTLRVGYRHGQCTNSKCPEYTKKWCSSKWQQLAPKHSSYGFDVIARIGWLRQNEHMEFERIHQELSQHVKISESQIRYLYYYRYLPLVACLQREQWEELERISKELGLVLSLDGLAPEGGEPQLWVVRELHTGLALRSGWMSEQSQIAFENFLEPIAQEIKARDLKILGIISDKQRGLQPAIETIFKGIPHGDENIHYLNNLAEPLAEADEKMKVVLRQRVREEVGDLIRQEKKESRGVLTVTGLIPSPVNSKQEEQKPSGKTFEQPYMPCQTGDVERQSYQNKADSSQNLIFRDDLLDNATDCITEKLTKQSDKNSSFENKEIDIAKQSNIFPTSKTLQNDNPFVHTIETVNLEPQSEKNLNEGSREKYETITQEQEKVVEALLRRARYLLTLKGRKPFCLAGLEMYERLTSLMNELDDFINHYAEPRLVALRQGIKTALLTVEEDYRSLQQARGWLLDISALLDKEEQEEQPKEEQQKQPKKGQKEQSKEKQKEQPKRTGDQVKTQLFDYLAKIRKEARDSNNKKIKKWAVKINKTTCSYQKGLFHTYDIEGLPRTNNDLEGSFKDYKRHLRRTTGQIGATRRLINRAGAWEILETPDSWEDIASNISKVSPEEFIEERERVRQHRERFQLHTRGAAKWVKAQFDKLKEIWEGIKPKAKPTTA